ncbi:MAG: hypothetical protein ACKOWK_02180 [Micrococcales bacterium]
MDENIAPNNTSPEPIDAAEGVAETDSEAQPSQGAPAQNRGVLGRIAALSKRTKIVVALVAVALLGGGGAYAYTAYQSPDVVVATALGSLAAQAHPSGVVDLKISSSGINATGSVTYANADDASLLSTKLEATLLATKLGATLNVVSTKSGDTYLNLADFDSVGSYLVQSGFLSDATFTSLKKVLTGKWVKVSKAELDTYTAASSQGNCISNLTSGDQSKSMAAQLGDALRANNFVIAKKELPQDADGNRVFELGIQADKLKGFLTAVRGTKYWSTLVSCSPAFNITDAEIAGVTQAKIDKALADSGVTVTLAANGGTHNLVSLEVAYQSTNSNDSADFKLFPTGDKSSEVKVPTDSVSVTDLVMALSGLGA